MASSSWNFELERHVKEIEIICKICQKLSKTKTYHQNSVQILVKANGVDRNG